MITKLLKLISSLTMTMIVLSIVPSGSLASENGNQTNLTDPMYGLRADPARNITEENFIIVQTSILDSINKKITELQSLYSEVSKASNASDLKKVLINHRQAHEGMGSGGRHMGHGGMNQGHCKIPELFVLNQVENVTDANYTDIQTEITDSLRNMTQMLEAEQTRLKEAGEDDRAEELGERITDLQNLSTNVSEASTAAELQEVIFTYVKTKAVDSLEKKVEHLQVKADKSKNTSDGNTSDKISSRITELTSLIEDFNGAESLEDLKEIMSSSRGIPGIGGDDPMHHGGCDCPLGPGRMQDNSTEV
jgi:hypothetical protein